MIESFIVFFRARYGAGCVAVSGYRQEYVKNGPPHPLRGISIVGQYTPATEAEIILVPRGMLAFSTCSRMFSNREPIQTQHPLLKVVFPGRGSGFAVGMTGSILHTAEGGTLVKTMPPGLAPIALAQPELPESLHPP
jgi:hypothetical protein